MYYFLWNINIVYMYYFLWNINIVYMSIFNIYNTFLEYMTTLYYVYVLENGIYDNGILDIID